MHSSLYRSGKSRRFNHNKFQRSQILSNGSFPCPLKGEILLQTINSHKKLKCYLTWLLIFFLFFFFGTTYLHTYPIPSPLLYICLFYNNCFCFLPLYFHFFNPQIPSFLFVHCPLLPWFASFDLLSIFSSSLPTSLFSFLSPTTSSLHSHKFSIKQFLDEVEHDIMTYQNQVLSHLPKHQAENWIQ